MEVHDIFHDRYELEKKLGGGGYSEVWLAKDTKTGVQIALKIFAKTSEDEDIDEIAEKMFGREFSLVAGLNHPNVLTPRFFDKCEDRPYIVLPYCPNGSVKNKLGKMSEEEAWRVMHDVANGLNALHHLDPPVIHQDIKPDNILIADDGHYMITDFGVSVHQADTEMRKTLSAQLVKAGTRAYMAPERFGDNVVSIMASDVYSLGATIFELLTDYAPYGEDGGRTQKSGYEMHKWEGNFSQEIKDVVERCLAEEPWKRPFVDELIQISQNGMSNKPQPNKTIVSSPINKKLLIGLAIGGLSIGVLLGLLPL